jgi:hypothetical protein
MAGKNKRSGSIPDREITHLVGQYQAQEVARPIQQITETDNLNNIMLFRVG